MREVEASVGQRLLWLLDHYRGGEGMINVPVAWRVQGGLDEAALAQAFDALVARHEALRTTFTTRGRRLFQVLGEPAPQHIEVRAAQDETEALAAMHTQSRAELDPAVGTVQATLWRIAGGGHLLLLNIHHLATDFFSNMILTRDLSWLYDRATGAETAEPPPVGWSYAQWCEWQREAFAAGRRETLQAFWTDRLAGAQPAVIARGAAPTGPARDARALDATGRATYDLDPAVVVRLQAAALGMRTTLFPLMLAGFYAHLHRTTGQTDLAVASLLANRARPEVADTVGFFVNMIVLRARVDPEAPFSRLVRACRTTFMEALRYGDLPLQLLPARTLHAADDVVFQYLEAPAGRPGALAFEALDLPVAVDAGRFALELVVFEREHFMLRYNRDFGAEWAREFLAGYAELLIALADAPAATVADLLAAPA